MPNLDITSVPENSFDTGVWSSSAWCQVRMHGVSQVRVKSLIDNGVALLSRSCYLQVGISVEQEAINLQLGALEVLELSPHCLYRLHQNPWSYAQVCYRS